jgi:hypothetical protein
MATGGMVGRPFHALYRWLMSNGASLEQVQIFWAPLAETLIFQGVGVGLPMLGGYLLGGWPVALSTSIMTSLISAWVYGSKLTHPFLYQGRSKIAVLSKPYDLNTLKFRGGIENALMVGILLPLLGLGMGQFGVLPPLVNVFIALAGAFGLYQIFRFHSITNLRARYSGRAIGTANMGSIEMPNKNLTHQRLLSLAA